MFKVDSNSLKIEMNEGDFGVILRINFSNIVGTNIVFKIEKNKETIIQKTFTEVKNNRIEVSLTEEETAKLDMGTYSWALYQFKESELKNTLLVKRTFRVVEGA